jgi:protein required for attachment to host cells
MTDLLETLILVFDGAKARFFKYQANGRLHETADMESGLHRFTRETVSDKPGRSFQSTGSGVRHAYEPKHDPHKMEKHNFVHRLVAILDDAFDQHAFKHLIVVAPERTLGEFRTLASPKLRNVVVREVPKELTQYTVPELEERLRPVLEAEAGPPSA